MRLLDLFCGAGGAAMGYARAGFEVVGVDHRPQPNFPFEFIQADVLEFSLDGFEGFDVIHASPPCQAFTRAAHLRDAQGGECSTPELLGVTRMLLGDEWDRRGTRYVIENVPGAPVTGIVLCGSMFGLKVRRHRLFETRPFFLSGRGCSHEEQGRPVGVYHVMGDEIPHGGHTAKTLEEAQEAMGIDWMTWDELKEAIPPAYTEYIGKQLIAATERAP